MKYLMVILIVLASVAAYGQERIEITKINKEIILDGIINEPIWEQISPLTFIQHKPVYGNKPTEHTEVRIAYDDNYIYVAGCLYDKEKIRSTSLERDGSSASNDCFGITIDSYNDKENAVAFYTTPSGLRWDGSIQECQSGLQTNINWNSFWDVATSVSEKGWFAEFKIPLSSLRFQNINGETTMGIITYRVLARNNEWCKIRSKADTHSGAKRTLFSSHLCH